MRTLYFFLHPVRRYWLVAQRKGGQYTFRAAVEETDVTLHAFLTLLYQEISHSFDHQDYCVSDKEVLKMARTCLCDDADPQTGPDRIINWCRFELRADDIRYKRFKNVFEKEL